MMNSSKPTAWHLGCATTAEWLGMQGSTSDRLLWLSTLLVAVSIIFSTAFTQAAAVAFMVVWVWTLVRGKGRGFTWTAFHGPVFLFMVARTASVLFSSNPEKSLPALYKEIIFYLIFFGIVDVLAVDVKRRVVILVRLLLVTALVAAVIGSVKYFASIDARATSTTAGYYTLGLYLCALFPFALALGRRQEFFPSRALWWPACCVIAVGVLVTFNRIHWLGMALTILVIGLTTERRFLVLFSCGVTAIVAAYRPFADRLYQLITFPSSSSGRDVLWRGALMLVDKHPFFGFGPRTFTEIFPLFSELPDKGIGSWHNDFLQVYMDSGVICLGALLWLIVVVYWKGIAAWRQKVFPPVFRDLLVALLLSMTMFFLAGGVLDTLGGLLFRMLLGILAVMTTKPLSGSWKLPEAMGRG